MTDTMKPKNRAAQNASQSKGTAYARQALLPTGLQDQLAPKAEHEALIIHRLVNVFMSYGYDRVAPPLVEYEESLLAGPGAAKSNHMFRLMDPDTQRTMAVRADMTVQMSRLAATRLLGAQRPLRLAYAGNVLRVKGSQVRPARQFNQAGFELIGDESIYAELEVIAVAVDALSAVGVKNLTLDLTAAPLTGAICDMLSLDVQQRAKVHAALDAKDSAAIERFDGRTGDICRGLLAAAGSVDHAVAALQALPLTGEAKSLCDRLETLVSAVKERIPDVTIIVDPCESHGFEYKSGLGFGIFARGAKGELGRGGRYLVERADGTRESATGFSVYLDSLVDILPSSLDIKKAYFPLGSHARCINKIRADGYRTIQGLTETPDPIIEAKRLGCGYVFIGGKLQPL